MSRDDSTLLPSEQDSRTSIVRDSRVYRFSQNCRRVSQYFGWPALLIFFLAPGDPIPAREIFYYFFLSAPVAFCAVLLRLMSQGYDRNQYFVVTGPYRYVRNPVELSAVLGYGAAGISLAIQPWITLCVMASAALFMSFVSIAYERDLLQRYGTQFVKYKSRVRRWLPLGLPAMNPAVQDYSLSLAVAKERGTWIWLVGYLLVYAVRQRTF